MSLTMAMVFVLFLPIVPVLAIAGTFAAQRPGVITAGTLRTYSPTFVFLIVGATLLIVGLEYLPALALGPFADALM
jgi:K+-transporting ATPase ATPase A chain